jgi:hypothetical protein
MRKTTYSIEVEQAEVIAIRALGYLAQNAEQLSRFLGLTGLTIETLRNDAGSHQVLAAVLDHLVGDESLLLTFAATAAISPQDIAAAHVRLSTPDDSYRST